MPVEIELKLGIPPEHAAALGRLPAVKAIAQGRAVTRRLYSVYYDTPEFDLRNQGVGLRLRSDGKRWTQTLKGGGRVEAGLHQREEIETPVPAQILNWPALANSAVSDVFTDAQSRQRVHPVFVADYRRTIRILVPSFGTQIEMSVDVGSLSAGGGAIPLSEIELELKNGDSSQMLELALKLVDELPVRLEPVSKAERGYLLAMQAPAIPVRASTPVLTADMSVTDAFRTVVFACIGHLQANERGVLESNDEEYLHQARVALRRLRSALTVFGSAFAPAAFAEVIQELRWLGGYLGPARDWDVFVSETLSVAGSGMTGDAGMVAVRTDVEALRDTARASAREAIASKRYTRLLLRFMATFLSASWVSIGDEKEAHLRAMGVREFAAHVLDRRHRKVVRGGKGHQRLGTGELHQLRIEIKKLRYAAEFLSALFEKAAVRDYTQALAELQGLLGSINDAATVERICAQLRPGMGSADAPEALGFVRGWAAATTRTQLEALPPAWKRFCACSKFW